MNLFCVYNRSHYAASRFDSAFFLGIRNNFEGSSTKSPLPRQRLVSWPAMSQKFRIVFLNVVSFHVSQRPSHFLALSKSFHVPIYQNETNSFHRKGFQVFSFVQFHFGSVYPSVWSTSSISHSLHFRAGQISSNSTLQKPSTYWFLVWRTTLHSRTLSICKSFWKALWLEDFSKEYSDTNFILDSYGVILLISFSFNNINFFLQIPINMRTFKSAITPFHPSEIHHLQNAIVQRYNT